MQTSTDRKETAYAELQAQILKLDLPPGTTLEETPIATRFGLSRTPMREVFQRLAAEGFVDLEPGRGASVADINLRKLRQFFQAAPLLHALIARLAAQAATPKSEQALRVAQGNVIKARVSRNAAALALADHGFHRTLCRIAGNPYLGPALERLLIEQTRMSQGFFAAKGKEGSAQIDRAVDEHEALIEAVMARDAGRAVALTMAHWEPIRAHIERHVQPEPLADEVGAMDGS